MVTLFNILLLFIHLLCKPHLPSNDSEIIAMKARQNHGLILLLQISCLHSLPYTSGDNILYPHDLIHSTMWLLTSSAYVALCCVKCLIWLVYNRKLYPCYKFEMFKGIVMMISLLF